MKFIKKVKVILKLVLFSLIILFSFFWKDGYYYFCFVLAGLVSVNLLMYLIEYIISKRDKLLAVRNKIISFIKGQNKIFKVPNSIKKIRIKIFKEKRILADVLNSIYELLPEEKKEKLNSEIVYWPPESMWEKLAFFINYNIPRDYNDSVSVKIYAILCNKKEEKIIRKFKRQKMKKKLFRRRK